MRDLRQIGRPSVKAAMRAAARRFRTDTVLVRRHGEGLILEPADEWPDDYVESFSGAPDDFERPAQGESEAREKLD